MPRCVIALLLLTAPAFAQPADRVTAAQIVALEMGQCRIDRAGLLEQVDTLKSRIARLEKQVEDAKAPTKD